MAAHASERTLVALLIGLTVVTGLVDAASYLLLCRVFVANMTGNVVFIAFALAGAQGFSIPASVLALVAFVVGAIVGGQGRARSAPGRGLLVHGHDRRGSAHGAGADRHGVLAHRRRRMAALPGGFLPGVALGTQNAVVRALGVRGRTTKVLTLTITGIGADTSPAGRLQRAPVKARRVGGRMFGGATAGRLRRCRAAWVG